jgi:hypothetical protein
MQYHDLIRFHMRCTDVGNVSPTTDTTETSSERKRKTHRQCSDPLRVRRHGWPWLRHTAHSQPRVGPTSHRSDPIRRKERERKKMKATQRKRHKGRTSRIRVRALLLSTTDRNEPCTRACRSTRSRPSCSVAACDNLCRHQIQPCSIDFENESARGMTYWPSVMRPRASSLSSAMTL